MVKHKYLILAGQDDTEWKKSATKHMKNNTIV